MKVRIAKKAGFCMGVRRAMELALEAGYHFPDPVYTYGPLIHNPQVLSMLEKKGIRILDPVEDRPTGTVVIRAHGIPPQDHERLKKSGCTIVDATCPRVIKVQAIIRKYASEGYTPIIVGDRNHPEVIGLLGYSQDQGIVLTDPDQVENLPELSQVIVVAQTTQDESLFQRVVEKLRERFPNSLVFNTICNATHERQEEVRNLARQVDGLVIVGGYDSGNTRRLAAIADSAGTPCFHVETEDQLDKKEIGRFKTVGVTAGASTPNWMIRKVVQELEMTKGQGEYIWGAFLFRWIRFLLKSNLMVALGAGCLSLAAARLRQVSFNWVYFAITFFHIYAMHILNHLLDRGASEYNDPDRSQFYQEYRSAFFISGIGAALFSLALALTLGWAPFFFLAAMSALGILYSFQIVPAVWQRFTRMKKIKDIPASKTLSVALGWGAVTTLIPAMAENQPLSLSLVLIFFILCSFVYIRSGLFDVLDIQGDLIVGKETLPIIIGEEKTIRFLKRLSLGTIIGLSACTFGGLLPYWSLWLLICFFYQFGFLIIYEKNRALPGNVFFEAMVEVGFILAGLLALLIP
ncbi:MAG: 4-hydroxy-3-methylbut-2-enyl diphosphate reductase [Deltaproteobacteria bacterium]|nr:4-hydroxy-3-methylbut-2-enyl diphosphate reductase [Deltaproteobacteria bacterium]